MIGRGKHGATIIPKFWKFPWRTFGMGVIPLENVHCETLGFTEVLTQTKPRRFPNDYRPACVIVS
jgi:hypothetical protein